MIAALLSDGNRWVNAQRIEVSGGVALYQTNLRHAHAKQP
jgi:hypothetical protein